MICFCPQEVCGGMRALKNTSTKIVSGISVFCGLSKTKGVSSSASASDISARATPAYMSRGPAIPRNSALARALLGQDAGWGEEGILPPASLIRTPKSGHGIRFSFVKISN